MVSLCNRAAGLVVVTQLLLRGRNETEHAS